MSKRKTKADNGYLAAVTNAHIGEALDADRQDFEEHPSSGRHGRTWPLKLFVEGWKRLLANLPKPGKPSSKLRW